MIIEKSTTICDWCGHEINRWGKTLDIEGDIISNCNICLECFKRLNFIMNWKNNKNSIVGVNFNNNAEITLGKDGAEAWNNRYSSINYFDNKQEGDIVFSQLHEICRGLAPAFGKMKGAYQGVAYPFELRFPINSLNLKLKEEDN